MNPARPSNTDTKEMITMAEEELARLQRQLRIMEDDRVAFSDETGTKLEKQRKIIQVLTKERDKFGEDIHVTTCANQKRRDKRFTKNIYKLLQEFEKYCQHVKNECEEIREIDVQIRKLEHDIRIKRPKSTVTDFHYQFRVSSGKKSVETLQNRLENVIKRFCGVLTDNKKLREEIDHLLKERSHYNIEWDKLLKDIHLGKKFMVELIEQATLAFDQREEWCSKLEALKRRAQNDLISHTEEMREMQRNLDHFANLREFLSVKGQKRILKDLEEKERKKKEFQEKNLENQLLEYKQTLDQIKNYCDQEENIEKIASLYIKQEEENFALFNYVNELNHEIEIYNANIGELYERIEEQVELSKQRSKEHQATLSSLQLDLDKSAKMANEDEIESKQVEDTLDTILQRIETIFDFIQCDRGPILDLIGKNTHVTIFNVMIYLGGIEKEISELITEIYFAEKSMMVLESNKNN